MSSPRSLFLLLVLASAACAANNTRSYSSGPNYSSTPCFDNCGSDPQCQASCTNTRNPNIPVPVYPAPGK